MIQMGISRKKSRFSDCPGNVWALDSNSKAVTRPPRELEDCLCRAARSKAQPAERNVRGAP